jgi:G protein-coupled receptor 107
LDLQKRLSQAEKVLHSDPIMAFLKSFLFSLFFLLLFSFSSAEIRFTEIRSDDRPIIPVDEFGFTHQGRLELKLSKVSFSDTNPDFDFTKVGFFLCTRDSWLHVLQQLEDTEITCALKSDLVKQVLTFKELNGKSEHNTLYHQNDADQYTLVFANCLQQVKVSMNVRSAMYNLDGKSENRDYLSAGKTILPRVFYLFSLIYFVLAGIWIYVLYKKRLTVFRIHFFMLSVVILKALNLLCEAEDKSWPSMRSVAGRL